MFLEKKEKNNLSTVLLNLILILIFQNPTLVKSKNENHQNTMCDSSEEPYGFTDHQSGEKTKEKITFDWFACKKKTDYFH